MHFRALVRRGLAGGIAASVILLATRADAAVPPRRVYVQLEPQYVNSSNGHSPEDNSFTAVDFTPGLAQGWASIDPEWLERLLFHMREATVPYNVAFVLERPMFGPYDMLVFGSKNDPPRLFNTAGCPLSVAQNDCGDRTGDSISFVFYDCQPVAEDMRQVAHSALRALGLSWGLEELLNVDGIMGRYDPFELRFESETCYSTRTLTCGVHANCELGTQNSHVELMRRIGPRIDDGPPTVEVLEPADLTNVESEFTVRARISDMFGGVKVALEVVEVGQVIADTEPPYAWNLADVPFGTWTLRVIATDADENVTTAEVVVTRAEEREEGSSSSSGGDESSSSGAESSSSSSTGESSSGSGSETGTDPPADDDGGGGCGCRAPGDAEPLGGLAGVVALGLLRRRRRAAGERGGECRAASSHVSRMP